MSPTAHPPSVALMPSRCPIPSEPQMPIDPSILKLRDAIRLLHNQRVPAAGPSKIQNSRGSAQQYGCVPLRVLENTERRTDTVVLYRRGGEETAASDLNVPLQIQKIIIRYSGLDQRRSVSCVLDNIRLPGTSALPRFIYDFYKERNLPSYTFADGKGGWIVLDLETLKSTTPRLLASMYGEEMVANMANKQSAPAKKEPESTEKSARTNWADSIVKPPRSSEPTFAANVTPASEYFHPDRGLKWDDSDTLPRYYARCSIPQSSGKGHASNSSSFVSSASFESPVQSAHMTEHSVSIPTALQRDVNVLSSSQSFPCERPQPTKSAISEPSPIPSLPRVLEKTDGKLGSTKPCRKPLDAEDSTYGSDDFERQESSQYKQSTSYESCPKQPVGHEASRLLSDAPTSKNIAEKINLTAKRSSVEPLATGNHLNKSFDKDSGNYSAPQAADSNVQFRAASDLTDKPEDEPKAAQTPRNRPQGFYDPVRTAAGADLQSSPNVFYTPAAISGEDVRRTSSESYNSIATEDEVNLLPTSNSQAHLADGAKLQTPAIHEGTTPQRPHSPCANHRYSEDATPTPLPPKTPKQGFKNRKARLSPEDSHEFRKKKGIKGVFSSPKLVPPPADTHSQRFARVTCFENSQETKAQKTPRTPLTELYTELAKSTPPRDATFFRRNDQAPQLRSDQPPQSSLSFPAFLEACFDSNREQPKTQMTPGQQKDLSRQRLAETDGLAVIPSDRVAMGGDRHSVNAISTKHSPTTQSPNFPQNAPTFTSPHLEHALYHSARVDPASAVFIHDNQVSSSFTPPTRQTPPNPTASSAGNPLKKLPTQSAAHDFATSSPATIDLTTDPTPNLAPPQPAAVQEKSPFKLRSGKRGRAGSDAAKQEKKAPAKKKARKSDGPLKSSAGITPAKGAEKGVSKGKTNRKREGAGKAEERED